MNTVKSLIRTGSKVAVRHGRGHWWTIAVVAVTLILYSIAWPTLPLTHDVSPPLMPLISALAVFPFLLVRTRPALGWAIAAAAALAIPWAFDRLEGYDYPWQVVHILVVLALLAAVSIREEIRVVLVVWLATVLLFFGYVPGHDGWGWAVGLTAIVVFGLLVRWLVVSRRQLAKEEEISELERARRAVLEEKARIARDLHDIVAHHMSMVVVQAQSAPYRLPDVSDDARAEFDSIGATAREALNEVRGLLGVLRSDGQLPENEPQPGIDRLDELFDGSRRAGMRLDAQLVGDPATVSDAAGLVVYRIIQEALANCARHAPGAEVTARVDISVDTVTVSVTNGPRTAPGTTRPPDDRAGGSGIRGMAERAMAVGGRLVAHPRPDGGFEVHAVLPTMPAAPVGLALDPGFPAQ
ncbi:sensor histidine kinase [Rhodococcus chondri]|uniref:histidine kinase n=1 Tax=Rhodococcus chondri TaxID=3065941 RepID=A0ABU7JWF4_9NOCA|nr:histidine kinase [Rhodococcus sp. CC-R104]MEE2034337.1 histidine kinase [Rhodococcus sp. CC-R104]